jgi:folate-binding protein YgfZ
LRLSSNTGAIDQQNNRSLPTGTSQKLSDSELDTGYQALKAGAGVRLCAERTIVRMTGDDRVSFLHGMCSNDVRGLAPCSVIPALFLTERAHLIAEANVWATPDALLLEMERTSWPIVRDHLDRLLVADDVEMEELDQAIIQIDGPLGPDIVTSTFSSVAGIAAWRFIEVGDGTRIAIMMRWGQQAFTIITPANTAADVAAQMVAAGAGREVREVSREAVEILRVESGVARPGLDTNDKTIALEARMGSAISFDKGCYVGQETVERATARGALKKRLMGLRITGSRIPDPDARVVLDGKEVGRLGSRVRSPRLGLLGLAILHHGAWTPGMTVAIHDASGETAATVSELPFSAD